MVVIHEGVVIQIVDSRHGHLIAKVVKSSRGSAVKGTYHSLLADVKVLNGFIRTSCILFKIYFVFD